MKQYIEFETAQELGDYLNQLNGKNAEFEWKLQGDDTWRSGLTDDARGLHAAMLHALRPPITVRVVVCPKAPQTVQEQLENTHKELRTQYEEDCKWYDKPWEFWEYSTLNNDEWFPLQQEPLWYCNIGYRRVEPTVIMPDGTQLPRSVDKVPKGANRYSYCQFDTKYKTEADRQKVVNYFRRLAAVARGGK